MKTLQEHLAEQAALEPTRKRRNRDRLKELNAFVDELHRSSIALYRDRDANPKLREELRRTMRHTIREGDAAALEIACDDCGVELFDVAPNVRSTSKPRLRQVGCPGCGWAAQVEL